MLKTFKVNLTTAHFPTLVSKASRSVALPDPADGVNTLTSTYVGRMAGTTMNTPAPIAMENVVPTIEGLASFGYVNAPTTGPNLLASKGFMFVATNDKDRFKPIQMANTTATTAATVQGYRFAFNPTIGLWRLDTGISEPMIGLSYEHGILGIVECNNHLVAYDRTTIYTSSIEVSSFFTPDLGTGAGASVPQDLTGIIVICVPVRQGFIIFSTKEAILATYKEPGILMFSLLEGVGGVSYSHNVSQYDTSGVVYAYTNNGLVVIDGDKVSPVFPEITEFLQLGYEESYRTPVTVDSSETIWASEAQTYPVTTDLVSSHRCYFNVGIFVVNSRYTYISYGDMANGGYFTHSFVYDSLLGRFGKLKRDHIAISCPHDTPLFVDPNGNSCSYGSIHFTADGFLLIGKIALQRDKTVTLQEVEIEYATPDHLHYLGVYRTLDGKNIIEMADLASMVNSAHYRKWNTRKSGKNLVLRLNGTFNLVSMQVTLSTGGFR